MKYLPYLPVLFIAGLIVPASVYGQGSQVSSRYVQYANLREQENYPFWRFRSKVSDLIFEAAAKGELPLLYFESFENEPQPLSFERFKAKLVMKNRDCAQEWKKDVNYFAGDLVQYQGHCYETIADSKNAPPPGNGLWHEIPTSYFGFDYLAKVGFDYQVAGKNSSLRYLHFYNEANEDYVVSCKAKDVVELLNSTNLLWYKEREKYLNHLIGDVFLFDRDDRDKVVHDLISNTDSTKMKRAIHFKPDTYYEILARFDRSKMLGLFLHQMNDLKLDTVPKTAIFRQAGSSRGWRLLGDALLNPSCIVFSTDIGKSNFKPLKNAALPAIASNRSIGNITYRTEVSLRYDQQIKMHILDSVFAKNMASLMEIIYQGLTNSKLNLFQTSNEDTPLTTEEVIRNLTARMPLVFDQWSGEGEYYIGDRVQYNDKSYESLRDKNSRVPPDSDTKSWKVVANPVILYLSGDFSEIEINYEIVFDTHGKILSKDPVSIELLAFEWSMGLYRPVGFVRYDQLQQLISTRPDLKKFCTDLVAQQYGLFEVSENSVLKAAPGKSR